MTKDSRKYIGPFSFCTKHTHSFYKSCGCPIPGSKKKQEVESTFVEDEQPNGALDV